MVLRLISPDADEASLAERFEAQSWLYRLTDAVSRASNLEEILEHALDCLQNVLRVERAAILLHDRDQVMRFRAWRNLSNDYRAAVDGHAPWKADDPDPQPVLIEDAAAEPDLEPLAGAIATEGIAALTFVPLVYGGRLLGKFMVYYPQPHRFEQLEIAIAQAVAGHVALAVGRHNDADELRRTREQLEIVLHNIADGVSAQTPDGRLLYGNGSAIEMLGFDSLEELTRSPASAIAARFEILDERGRPFPLEELPGRLALEGRDGAERLVRFRRRDSGAERWSYVRATPVFDADGQVRFAVNVFQDVTAQRRSEEAARFVADVTGVLAGSLEPDETCARLADALVPRLADACAIYTVDDGVMCRAATAGSADEALAGIDHDVQRAIAEDTVVAAGAIVHLPLRGRERILGALSLARDDLARHFDASELTLAEELARRGAVAIEAALLYHRATEAIQLRDDFLSVAGHELRTPLTTAHILVQSMRRQEMPPAGADARLGKLELTLTRLARLIDDLLDVTRIRAGRLELEAAPTELGDLVCAVAARCRDQAARAGCELRVDLAGHSSGRWDSHRLDQVVENLVSNALKYAPGQPVELRVEGGERQVTLTVRDRGAGIEQADRGRVFGRFERATSSRHHGGLGLGLWIARRIVEAHGGTIAFTDTDGVGCCVQVTLPR